MPIALSHVLHLMCALQGGGWTALIYASRYGHKEIAQYLVDKGASLDIKSVRVCECGVR